MPRLIIKNSYIKGGGERASHLSNLVKYIATRDGVELVYRNPSAKATTKQKDLVKQILRDFPNAKNSFEYEDYKANPTVSNASDFITSALEQNFDRIAKKENYVGYIAYRPNVEKLESHGLFTSGDEKIILSQVATEIANHEGNVWTPIISLRREDAVETGYDNAERFKNMLESYVPTIAEGMKVPLDKFRWYASFHNESHHPHIHMICYSTDTRYGYLNQNGIDKIKSGMVKEIFKEQLYDIYQRQTQSRDKLKMESEKVFRELKQKVLESDFASPKLEQLILVLNEKLKNAKGKKQYGYLQPHAKDVVNAIVDELAEEPSIKSAYELWCELQQEVYQSYSDTPPPPIPLSQQKEFKSIKNMIIREVLNLDMMIEQSAERIVDEEVYSLTDDESADDIHTVEYHAEESVGNKYHITWSDEYKQANKYLHGDGETQPDFSKALELMQAEADSKNALAIFDLARMYADGLGVDIDNEKSEKLYATALLAFKQIESKKPWKYTQYRIGKMYSQGLGTVQDYEVAADWFTLSANEEYKYAQYSLGGLYYRGQGVEQNYKTAFNLYLESAKQGFPYAQYEVAKMYRDGVGTEQNITESYVWFGKAFVGFEMLEKQSHDDKLQYRLGAMLHKGIGVEVDIPRAKKYFEMAAKVGNTFACYSLAKLILEDTVSTHEEIEKAIVYLQTSADSGNQFAQYTLGKVYLDETYATKNIAKAMELLDFSAKQGNEFAKYKLGSLYLKGEDVQKDIPKAIDYLTDVAENGNQYAQYQLGKLYLLGKDVEQDRDTAIKWLNLSAEQGNEYAQFFIDNIDKWSNPSVGMCVSRLLGSLGRLFEEQLPKDSTTTHQKIDSKAMRKIREKKLALGQKIGPQEEENIALRLQM
ncbi:MAG: MobP3 family relaxase [Eubacteriales bacterium]